MHCILSPVAARLAKVTGYALNLSLVAARLATARGYTYTSCVGEAMCAIREVPAPTEEGPDTSSWIREDRAFSFGEAVRSGKESVIMIDALAGDAQKAYIFGGRYLERSRKVVCSVVTVHRADRE